MNDVFALACSILLPLEKPMASMNDAPCRVSAETDKHLRDQEQRERDAMRDWPDFTQQDQVQAVADRELAEPIAKLISARDQLLKTGTLEIKEQLVEDMLGAVSALERGLFQRWQDL